MGNHQRESRDNWDYVCDAHAPKSGGFVNMDPKLVLNKYVKLGFSTSNGGKEHMWVLVHDYDEGAKEFHGTLDNDPALDVGVKCGDQLAFTIDEIEQVLDPEKV